MDRRNIVKYYQEIPYYLGLHKPKIKGLYSGQIRLVDELQKIAVDCNRGLYYIVNMTKPGTERQ